MLVHFAFVECALFSVVLDGGCYCLVLLVMVVLVFIELCCYFCLRALL